MSVVFHPLHQQLQPQLIINMNMNGHNPKVSTLPEQFVLLHYFSYPDTCYIVSYEAAG